MAKDDSKSRVYKAGEVHKRRAEKKPRVKAKGEGRAAVEGKSAVARVAVGAPAGQERPVAEEGPAGVAPAAQGKPAGQERPAVEKKPAVKEKGAAKARPSVKGKAVAEGKTVPSMTSSLTEPIGVPVAEGSDETKPAVSPAAQTRPIVVPSKESFSSRLKSNEPDGADGGEGEGSEGSGGDSKGGARKRWKLRVGIGVAVVLAVALAVCAAVYSWNRWARYDDAADMQGVWYAYGTSVPVTFTEDQIVFDGNTAYSYEIDADAKTIRYRIGDLEGQGRYWFSDDRGALVITDGEGYDKWGTVLEDLGFWVSGLFRGASLPVTEDSIAFSRVAMSEGLLTAPEAGGEASEASGASGSAAASESGSEQGSDAEQPDGEGQQADDSRRGAKDDMKQMPISDIIIEDDTPTWGESNE